MSAAATVRRIAVVLLLALAAGALAGPPVSVSVRVDRGLGAHSWSGPVPVTVEVEVPAGHLSGDLCLVSGTTRGPLHQRVSLDLDGPAHKVFHLLDPADGTGEVYVQSGAERIRSVTKQGCSWLQNRSAVAVVGEAPGYAAAAELPIAEDSSATPFESCLATALQLPVSPFGYGAVTLVVLRGRAAASLEPAQVRALLDWVRLGGRLLISPGIPPAPLHDVEWLQPLLPAGTGAPRSVPAAEVERQLHGKPPGGKPLDAVTLLPLPNTHPSSLDTVPLAVARALGAGHVELLGFDETALDAPGLRAFVNGRMAGLPVLASLEGSSWMREPLRLVLASWARGRDVVLAVALIGWLFVLWVLSRLPAGGPGARGRSAARRLLFRPGVAVVVALALFTRRAPPAGPAVEVIATLEAGLESSIAAGQTLFAVRGPAGRPVDVPLPEGRALPASNTMRRALVRTFLETPDRYRVRAGPAPALEGLLPQDGLPVIADVAVELDAGGTWTADLHATGRETVDGWITNGTAWPLEHGYLVVDAHVVALPAIPAGGTRRGPFALSHPSTAARPAGVSEELGDTLASYVMHSVHAMSFPPDGLEAVPGFWPHVVGTFAVPPARYSPACSAATTLATFHLPRQEKKVRQ